MKQVRLNVIRHLMGRVRSYGINFAFDHDAAHKQQNHQAIVVFTDQGHVQTGIVRMDEHLITARAVFRIPAGTQAGQHTRPEE